MFISAHTGRGNSPSLVFSYMLYLMYYIIYFMGSHGSVVVYLISCILYLILPSPNATTQHHHPTPPPNTTTQRHHPTPPPNTPRPVLLIQHQPTTQNSGPPTPPNNNTTTQHHHPAPLPNPNPKTRVRSAWGGGVSPESARWRQKRNHPRAPENAESAARSFLSSRDQGFWRLP